MINIKKLLNPWFESIANNEAVQDKSRQVKNKPDTRTSGYFIQSANACFKNHDFKIMASHSSEWT